MIVIQNVAFFEAEVCNETKLLSVLLSSELWLFSDFRQVLLEGTYFKENQIFL